MKWIAEKWTRVGTGKTSCPMPHASPHYHSLAKLENSIFSLLNFLERPSWWISGGQHGQGAAKLNLAARNRKLLTWKVEVQAVCGKQWTEEIRQMEIVWLGHNELPVKADLQKYVCSSDRPIMSFWSYFLKCKMQKPQRKTCPGRSQ